MEEDNHYGFAPITKPRDTKKTNIIKAEVCVIIVVTVLLLIYRAITSASSNNSMVSYSDIYNFTGIVCSIILYQLIRRCCLFAEEYHHIDGRYSGSSIEAVKACLSLSEGKSEIGLVFVVSIAYTIKSWLTSTEQWVFPIILFIIIKLVVSVAVKRCGYTPLSRVEISEMNECDIKNVSEGLAWSFYFKYLKKVLPQLDNMFQQATGENFRVDGGDICDEVKDKRLFLIIPKDGYCYKTFTEVDDRLILVDRDMLSFKDKSGCGGGERIYKNSLYEVSMENMDSKYAVMEYATPLLSLYDMSVNAKVKFTEENRAQQVIEFYKKLKLILEDDPECHGKYSLVLTGPGAIKVPIGQKKLADIIWEAIN